MRFFPLFLFITALTACSSPWAPEKPVPKGETRQQTCQPSSNPNQTDCGHFPEPEFH
ncbi:MAG: hypothetical protein QRY16_17160 [Enterobacterales bacterium endosymbiont of Blomia tropicalis]|uniref:hypothetical protein n=1 Tax=Mixta mediterraneensis TaxID=2758443 RepID=UPI0025A8AEA2|nr:hypothetical protein [Mixta mediterraneensis]MDL4915433.1 hypothetical protein [Mixta mediterraneensis]